MQPQPCSGCGVMLMPADVLYNTDAKPECARCHGKADLLATDKRAAENIKKSAFACLGAGLLSIFAPLAGLIAFAFAVLVAALSGIYALTSLRSGNERFTQHLTRPQRVVVVVVAVVGLAAAGTMTILVLRTLNQVLA